MSVDTMEVDRLLAASRQAHDAKKRNAGVINKAGDVIAPPNYAKAEQSLVEALTCRLDAHDLDPEHTAPGWLIAIPPARIPTTEAELIRFYVAYAKPLIPPDVMARVIARFPAYAEIRYIP